jgi:DNA-binding transcriptional LysR family regulator
VWPLRHGGSFTVEPALIASDVHLLRQCVLAGLGVALLPDALLPDPRGEIGAVVAVLSDLPKIKAVLRHTRAFTEGL